MALNAAFRTADLAFGMLTIIIGHATFCVVIVYNNVLARERRISRHLEEASMDLGADQWQTFRHVTFPAIRTALLAGGLLAFALSFDEVIVTTFTTGGGERTIPIWMLQNYSAHAGPAHRQRGGAHPHPALDHPGLHRPAPGRRGGDRDA